MNYKKLMQRIVKYHKGRMDYSTPGIFGSKMRMVSDGYILCPCMSRSSKEFVKLYIKNSKIYTEYLRADTEEKLDILLTLRGF